MHWACNSSNPNTIKFKFNSWIPLSSCGAKYTHRDFRPLLVRNLIEEAEKSQAATITRMIGGTSAATTNVRPKSHHNQHRTAKSSTQLCCRLCFSHGQRKGTAYKCARCDIGLCLVPCFTEKNTRENL